jgi:hypothetical protein
LQRLLPFFLPDGLAATGVALPDSSSAEPPVQYGPGYQVASVRAAAAPDLEDSGRHLPDILVALVMTAPASRRGRLSNPPVPPGHDVDTRRRLRRARLEATGPPRRLRD